MTTYRIADRRRWTSVSNGLIEDGSISFRARGLLVWLLSKPDGWSVRSEVIAAATTEGRDAVRSALNELEKAGYIKREKARDEMGRWVTFSNIYESPGPENPAPGSRPSDSQALSTNNGEAITEQQPSSVPSEGQLNNQVVNEYWEWYIAEHPGLKPTIGHDALRGVVGQLRKAGHQPDDIVDAMKTARGWTRKVLADEIARKRALAEERPTTAAIPHVLVRAFAKAEPFFARRHPMKLNRAGQNEMMVRCSMMLARGFDVGETMIRLSLVLRAGDDSTWALANVECPRFPGELDDYADSMERAWTNRRWNVS